MDVIRNVGVPHDTVELISYFTSSRQPTLPRLEKTRTPSNKMDCSAHANERGQLMKTSDTLYRPTRDVDHIPPRVRTRSARTTPTAWSTYSSQRGRSEHPTKALSIFSRTWASSVYVRCRSYLRRIPSWRRRLSCNLAANSGVIN